MNIKHIKLNIVLLIVFFIFIKGNQVYSSEIITFEDRYKILTLLKIFDNNDGLDELMTRNDFAKCLVKISPYKDKTIDFVDVATKNGYMYRKITGEFNGEDFVRYNDVSRGCLALLGYTNDDFKGNQVIGRNTKFKDLYLDENIDKEANDYFTRRDVANAIYNTLRTEARINNYDSDDKKVKNVNNDNKVDDNESNEVLDKDNNSKSIVDLIEKANGNNGNYDISSSLNDINILSNTSNKNFYGKKIFEKLVLRLDNELSADAYIERELIGPYIIKPGMSFTSKFEITDNNIYINGLKCKKEDLEFDIGAYGFALIYYDNTNSVIYAYTYREDIEANVYLRKDYINEIYYNANDMTMPYKLMIGDNKYFIDSEDMKFMFSPSGKYREGDLILFIASKYLDKDSYSEVNITYDETNKRYHFFNDNYGREIYYSSGDKKWYYDAMIEDDSDIGYKVVKKEYTGGFFVREHDDEHISGGIIYAMKF